MTGHPRTQLAPERREDFYLTMAAQADGNGRDDEADQWMYHAENRTTWQQLDKESYHGQIALRMSRVSGLSKMVDRWATHSYGFQCYVPWTEAFYTSRVLGETYGSITRGIIAANCKGEQP